MVAVHEAKTEVINSKGNTKTCKAGIINDSQQTEIQVLPRQLANLMSIVQGSQDKGGEV